MDKIIENRKERRKMKIENDLFQVEIIEKGGEIQSFYDKEKKVELMWQGQSEYWQGKNPTLFPIVGNTWTKDYEWKGQTYAMKNHGLIRYATLSCVNQSEDSITMELKSNDETRAQYPFDFTYQIQYVLKGNRLEIIYHITNDSNEAMPFIFGLHPGFQVPCYEDEAFDDYELVFPCVESAIQVIQKEGHMIEQEVSLDRWRLNHEEIYDVGTLIYRNCKSPYVDLVGKHHKIRVSIVGYKYLALWSAANHAPFLCIEPWYGHGDFEESHVSFDKRLDTILLSPNKTFTTSYFIEIDHR